MKVLHVIPSVSPVHGGPSQAVTLMERVLCDGGIAVTTVTTDDDGPGRRLPLAKQRSHEGQAKRVYHRKLTEFYKVSPRLFVWLLSNVARYDVVHIHALFTFSSIAAALAAKLRGVPYIVRPLGVLNQYGVSRRRPRMKAVSLRLIEGPILSCAAAVHFTSLIEAEEAAAIGVAMCSVIIPLAIDPPPEIDPTAAPFRLEPGERVVLFLSRIDPKKNIDGLIRAFARLSRTHKKLRLVIAGSGAPDYVRTLQRLAETEGVADDLVWTGHIEGDTKWAALAAANVFVLPSHSENFGIAALEALASGCPCVLGEGIAIAREIADQGAALITSSDPADIAVKIERVLDDHGLALALSERARRLAATDYTSEAMGERLIKLYEEAIAGFNLRRKVKSHSP